jgi:hypothetical protein
MVRDLTVNQTYTEMLWGFESLPKSTAYLNKLQGKNLKENTSKVGRYTLNNGAVKVCDISS